MTSWERVLNKFLVFWVLDFEIFISHVECLKNFSNEIRKKFNWKFSCVGSYEGCMFECVLKEFLKLRAWDGAGWTRNELLQRFISILGFKSSNWLQNCWIFTNFHLEASLRSFDCLQEKPDLLLTTSAIQSPDSLPTANGIPKDPIQNEIIEFLKNTGWLHFEKILSRKKPKIFKQTTPKTGLQLFKYLFKQTKYKEFQTQDQKIIKNKNPDSKKAEKERRKKSFKCQGNQQLNSTTVEIN